MARTSKYPQELRERAIRMVAEVQPNYGSEYEAIRAVASKLGIGTPESLRKWIRQSQVDGGQRPGGPASRRRSRRRYGGCGGRTLSCGARTRS
jgi:transposase